MERISFLRGKFPPKFPFCPRLSGVAVIALFTLLATAAHATDTSRLHRAHQTESSKPAKSAKSKPSHNAAKPASRSTHSVAQSKYAPHPHRRIPEPQSEPVIMHRAHSTPRSRAIEQRHVAQMLAEARNAPRTQISAQAPSAVKKTLTTEDFMRAAGETPTEAIVTPAPSNSYAPAQAQRPQSERVDGFGAEGAMLTSSRHSTIPAPLPPPSQVDPEDPELAALAHPSREELAESALQPRLPNLYSSNGHLIIPAPLVGSHDVLVHQNEMADAEGLSRIENDEQLASLRAKHLLVDIPESASLQLNPDLPDNRRCARPWTVKFATDMARAYYARFHQALQINSAARTVQYQVHLERINGNAAGIDGEGASPHLTGQAIDFGKRGMSLTQIAWMRGYLKPLMQAGKLDVEEEFHQACFHISVYRAYAPTRKPTPHNEVAQLGTAGADK